MTDGTYHTTTSAPTQPANSSVVRRVYLPRALNHHRISQRQHLLARMLRAPGMFQQFKFNPGKSCPSPTPEQCEVQAAWDGWMYDVRLTALMGPPEFLDWNEAHAKLEHQRKKAFKKAGMDEHGNPLREED